MNKILIAIFALAASPALAATITAPLTGTALTIDSPCARHVEITPDATLHNQVNVQATADYPEEINKLILESQDAARIRTRDLTCFRTGLFENKPTLTITIRVPEKFALTIDDGGAGTYTIGPVGGPLNLDISGAINLIAEHIMNPAINLSGAGNIQLSQVEGDAKLDLSGSGRIDIAQANIGHLKGEISGAGSINVRAGQIGHVELDNSGFGSANFAAITTDARVDISGAGSVHFSKVTGHIDKEISGLGSVTTGE